MKKQIYIMALVVMMLTAWTAWAGWRPLLAEEKAEMGANWELAIGYADFAAVAGTNLNYTNNFAVPAKSSVALVGMKLVTAFDTGNTNFTGSCAVKVGDAADDDKFLASTELASDGTEIFMAFPRASIYTATTTNVTWIADVAGATTNTQALVLSIAATAYGSAYYNVATNVRTIFTPNYAENLSANTSGSVKMYFRVLQNK